MDMNGFVWSYNNQEIEYITNNYEELIDIFNKNNDYITLNQEPGLWFKNLITNDEYYINQFSGNIFNYNNLQYNINFKGLPDDFKLTNDQFSKYVYRINHNLYHYA